MLGITALAGAVALVAGGAQAQTAPLVWDGIVVPTNGTCSLDTPVSWRATYRPYIADTVNSSMPSQLVVYTNYQRNDYGLRANIATAQFKGSGSAGRYFIGSELINASTQSNTGGPGTANYNFTQSPANVKANTAYIKITGTIVNPDSSPGLGCASAIIGVFVKRTQ
jgi:hypothetical protein